MNIYGPLKQHYKNIRRTTIVQGTPKEDYNSSTGTNPRTTTNTEKTWGKLQTYWEDLRKTSQL